MPRTPRTRQPRKSRRPVGLPRTTSRPTRTHRPLRRPETPQPSHNHRWCQCSRSRLPRHPSRSRRYRSRGPHPNWRQVPWPDSTAAPSWPRPGRCEPPSRTVACTTGTDASRPGNVPGADRRTQSQRRGSRGEPVRPRPDRICSGTACGCATENTRRRRVLSAAQLAGVTGDVRCAGARPRSRRRCAPRADRRAWCGEVRRPPSRTPRTSCPR